MTATQQEYIDNLKAEIEHLEGIIDMQAIAMKSLILKPITDKQINNMFCSEPPSIYFCDRTRKRDLELYYFGVRDCESFHGIK